MIKVYNVKYSNTTIDYIEAHTITEAKTMADVRWNHYDEIVCEDNVEKIIVNAFGVKPPPY